MKRQIKLEEVMSNGWILKTGQVVPFEFKAGQPVRWLKTSYAKRGDKLEYPNQDFWVQQVFLERVG